MNWRLLYEQERAARLAAEQRLQDVSYRAIADHAPVLLWVSDSSRNITYFGETWRNFFGMKPPDEAQNSYRNFIHPDDVEPASRQYNAAFAVRQPLVMEFRARHTDGQYRWLLDTGIPYYDAAGEFCGYVGSCVDITERKEAEEERQYLLSKARCLLWHAEVEETHEEYLWWKMRMPDVLAAQAFLPLALLPGEAYKDGWYRCRDAEDRIRCDREGTAAVRAGQDYSQEFRCHCADGAVRWVREDIHVETLVPGVRWSLVAVCTDITLQKRLLSEVENLNARLKRAILKTHHRVKNNLQYVIGLAELQVSPDRPFVETAAIERMKQHISTLTTIHDLLTRDMSDESLSQAVPVEILLDQLLTALQQTADTRELHFQVTPRMLSGRQATALALITNELVSNALKHGTGRVDVTFTRKAGEAVLEVLDDGAGFPEGFNVSVSGSLGLQLVESMAQWDLHGTLRYENRSGGGAQVTLTFPV